MYPAGVRSATSSSGTSNFGSWVSTQMTVLASTSVPGQEAVRPVDHHLVGVGEARRGGEHLPGVAHGDVITEELADPGDGGGEVDSPEDQHPRRRRERVHEHAQVVPAPLAVRAVPPDTGQALGQHAAGHRRRPPRRAAPIPGCLTRRSASRPAGRCRRPSTPVARRPGPDRRSRSRRQPARRALPPRRSRPARGSEVLLDLLDEDVDDPAAGQPDRERVVVTYPVKSGRPASPVWQTSSDSS